MHSCGECSAKWIGEAFAQMPELSRELNLPHYQCQTAEASQWRKQHKMTIQIRDFSLAVNSEVATSIHDSGIVFLHIGNGCLYASNGVGARIWRGVEKHLSSEAIAAELCDEYRVDLATAREHILCFLAQLEAHTLIQRQAES